MKNRIIRGALATLLSLVPITAWGTPLTASAHTLPSTMPGTLSATFSGQDQDASQAHIVIDSVGEPTLAPGKDLTLNVTITNPTGDPLTINALDIRAQVWPASTPAHVSAWMSGDLYGYQLRHTVTDLVIPAGQSTSQTLTVPRDDISWKNTTYFWGPRGIAVDAIVSDGSVLTDRSYVVVTPDTELPRSLLTAVVPVVNTLPPHPATPYELISHTLDKAEPPVSTGSTDTETAEVATQDTPKKDGKDTKDGKDAQKSSPHSEETSNIGALLNQWDIPGITLFTDPKISLTTPVNNAEIHALPAYDADLAALAHANASDRIATYLDSAKTDVWFADDLTDIDTLRAVRNAGIPAAIIPDSQLTPAGEQIFVDHAHTSVDIDGNPMPVLTANSVLSDAVSGTLAHDGDTITLDSLDRQQVSLALSAILYRQQPHDQRGVVVTANREMITGADAEQTRQTLTVLTQAPWNEASSVNALLASRQVGFNYEPLPDSQPSPGEFSAEELTQYDETVSQLRHFAAVFPQNDKLDAILNNHINAFFATSWRNTPEERATYATTLNTIDTSTIKVETSSTINLISESSSLPIHVANSYDYPVNVTVTVTAPDRRLHAREPATATIPAHGTTQVMIPVEAWGSGNLDVDVAITDSSGLKLGESSTVHVRVRANWENTGTIVVALLIGFLFVAGVIKSIRNGRRSDPVDPQFASHAIHQASVSAVSASKPLSENSE